MRIPEGVKAKDLKLGTGVLATKGVVVLVHYDCFLPRGEKIDTSRGKPFPVQFEIGRRKIFPGLEYGVLGMRVGGIRSIRVSPQPDVLRTPSPPRAASKCGLAVRGRIDSGP
jgi:FKBP-type peptidyl-prolyl cis-trans isomerase